MLVKPGDGVSSANTSLKTRRIGALSIPARLQGGLPQSIAVRSEIDLTKLPELLDSCHYTPYVERGLGRSKFVSVAYGIIASHVGYN